MYVWVTFWCFFMWAVNAGHLFWEGCKIKLESICGLLYAYNIQNIRGENFLIAVLRWEQTLVVIAIVQLHVWMYILCVCMVCLIASYFQFKSSCSINSSETTVVIITATCEKCLWWSVNVISRDTLNHLTVVIPYYGYLGFCLLFYFKLPAIHTTTRAHTHMHTILSVDMLTNTVSDAR